MAASPVSRRGFLRAAGLTGLGLGVPSLLSACGTPAAKQTAGSCVSTDLSASEKTLHFSNWPLYIDEKKVKRTARSHRSPRSRSSSRTPGSRSYVTDINDNEEFFGKSCATSSPTASRPAATSSTLTDWMAARMVELGWIQKLDKANIPNVDANLV